MTIKQEERLHRASLICLHCARNLSYYKARRIDILKDVKNQFWRTADSNFIDMCIMEWCKLFADSRGMHSWKKLITNHVKFFSGLLTALNCTETEFNDYISKVKDYRDKFIAHLDEENIMNIPVLDWIKISVFYLYEYLLTNEEQNDCFSGAPDIKVYYSKHDLEAKEIYKNLK